jgi:hypothetical protein
MQKNRSKNKTNLRSRIGMIVLAVLLVGCVAMWLYLRGSGEPDNAAKTTDSVKVNQPPSKTMKTKPDAQIPNPAPTPNANVPGGTNNGSTELAAPSGTFVSNHAPSLGNSSRSQESSVCNTTPGATCVISFTMGSTTKTLDSKVADDNGAASWDWSPGGLGLSAGSWTIKATATRDGQSKSSQDSLPLNVSP